MRGRYYQRVFIWADYSIGISFRRGEENSADETALKYIESLGGAENIFELTNCATRLRLILSDATKINEVELKNAAQKEFLKKVTPYKLLLECRLNILQGIFFQF